MKTLRTIAALVPLLLAAVGPASGHDLTFTDTVVVFKTDGTYQVDMTCDLDALALGASPEVSSELLANELRSLSDEELEAEIEDLRQYFLRRVRVIFDGEAAAPAVSFPDRGTPIADEAEEPTVLGLTARLEGVIPEGASEFQFRASRSFPLVHLTVLDQQSAAGVRTILERGGESQAFVLGEPLQPPDRMTVAGQYLILGFWHIIPEGIDHILFVLGLFLLSARLAPLLWQITAFTLAHTVTLALSTFGVVSISPGIVEPLIALSIAYVAIENVLTDRLEPWRPAVVFAFGLLHGLGFAGVLRELGLPEQEYLTALLTFNAGVELGQLAVIVLALLAVGWFRDRAWYRRRIVIPCSLAIATVGLYWAVERAFF